MLPAYPLAAVMVGVLVTRLAAGRRRVLIAGVIAVMAFNLLGWVDAATRGEDGEDGRGRRLLALLDEHGLTRCYSAGPLYHLVFASNEEVVIAPLQKDRYPAYNDELERAGNICYVFRDDQQRKRKSQHQILLPVGESPHCCVSGWRPARAKPSRRPAHGRMDAPSTTQNPISPRWIFRPPAISSARRRACQERSRCWRRS